MSTNVQRIADTLQCSTGQAVNVEQYINQGNMINWEQASSRLIRTIARAVNDKLLRDAPRKKVTVAKIKVKTITSYSGKQVEVGVAPKKSVKKVSAPATGSKASRAMAIYKRYEGCTRQEMITYLVSEMASNHGVELTRQQAAGLYQSCKKVS